MVSSSEVGGEIGLGWPSFVKGELLIKGRQGGREKHSAPLKIAQMFYSVKSKGRKSPVRGRGCERFSLNKSFSTNVESFISNENIDNNQIHSEHE